MVRTLPLFCYTSGEEAIAFFLKHGPACPVKFVHLERKYPASHDIFRPYDLIVVPEVRFRKRHLGSISPPPPPTLRLPTRPRQAAHGGEYFVMSAKGVVHIDPGAPSEFLTLSDWMRDASAFNICTSMRFFKHFLYRKMFSQWRANVRFNRFCKQRLSVQRRLYAWKPAFAAALGSIAAVLAEMERLPLLDLTVPRFTATSFVEAQATARAEQVKVIERQIAAIQGAMERVCADVAKRARARDDDDEEGGAGAGDGAAPGAAAQRAREAKTKSMAAAKAEAARKLAALRAAAAEEALLGSFVRLVDYMVVETVVRLFTVQFAGLLKDLTEPDHKRATTGMFASVVRFDSGSGACGGSGAARCCMQHPPTHPHPLPLSL
jgi:dynein heavy chain